MKKIIERILAGAGLVDLAIIIAITIWNYSDTLQYISHADEGMQVAVAYYGSSLIWAETMVVGLAIKFGLDLTNFILERKNRYLIGFSIDVVLMLYSFFLYSILPWKIYLFLGFVIAILTILAISSIGMLVTAFRKTNTRLSNKKSMYLSIVTIVSGLIISILLYLLLFVTDYRAQIGVIYLTSIIYSISQFILVFGVTIGAVVLFRQLLSYRRVSVGWFVMGIISSVILFVSQFPAILFRVNPILVFTVDIVLIIIATISSLIMIKKAQ
ncbi:MAG: hypothetical protein LBM27_03450 [Lactobacillaceae bacterium]|jgi:hypothetical protein|nr:hypothetical protein [Lactobacillaceae bacterium]